MTKLPEGWEKGYWIVEFGCDCSVDVRFKKDAPRYCADHGNDRRMFYRVPPAPKYGPKRSDHGKG